MGYEQVENTRLISIGNMSAGWFPGKEHNEIPGDLNNPNAPIGASACDHVVWADGALRKIFGFNNVNSSAAESGATFTGLIDFTGSSNNLVGTINTKLYKNLHQASPTDITGALSITADVQVQFVEYRIGSTKLVIGVNGTDAPFKWSGTGNGAALGGSPPTATWIEYFNNYVFLANVSGNEEKVYFSGLSNPESWDTTNDFFTFDDEITGIKAFGRMLVVFKRNSIGILSGYGRATWAKTDQYIKGIGCVGGHTIKNGRIGGSVQRDVLFFLADDGIYAFDGTPNIIKISIPIERKFIASASADRFNESRFSNAVATYSDKYNWYVLNLSDGSDSTNDFMLIIDCGRPFQMPIDGRLALPHWPVDGIDANTIVTRQVSGADQIYFGGTDGFIYLFDESIYNENDAAYTGYFTSKIFDMKEHWIIREFNILGDEIGDVDVTLSVNADLQEGDGETATVNMNETADVLDSTFIIGTSTLGGADFLYQTASLTNYGRFLQFKCSQNIVDDRMVIEQLDIILKRVGLRPNV